MATLETNETLPQSERRMLTLQIQVPEEVSRRLTMIAAALGISRSEALTRIVDETAIPEPPRAA